MPDGTRRDQGQGLTEFAIVIPFLIVLFMGVMEFALALGASLGVNRASQNAAHVAASAGALVGADCLILQSVERDITIPTIPARSSMSRSSRMALAGNVTYAQQIGRAPARRTASSPTARQCRSRTRRPSVTIRNRSGAPSSRAARR